MQITFCDICNKEIRDDKDLRYVEIYEEKEEDNYSLCTPRCQICAPCSIIVRDAIDKIKAGHAD